VDIQDIPWIEIDNEIDLNRAQSEIGPKVDAKRSK
jgi:choline kinase